MPYPRRLLWDIPPRNTPNSQNLLQRCPPTDFTDLHRYLWCAVLPQNTPNSQNLLLRCPPTDFTDLHRTYGALFSHRIHRIHRIWQRGYGRDAIPSYICVHLCHLCHLWEALLCQKFLCVPCVLWKSLSSHGFHRFTQILRVRCSPTEFTEYTEFGSVGMAGMPYPPISVNIRAHLWEALLSQKFLCVPCVLWEYLFSHGFHRFTHLHPLGWQRGYGRDAIPSYICAHPCHLWESFLCKRFCVFGAFRGSFFTACFVGAAETAAPPGGIHGSSVQISPFHLEPSLLHVLPVLWVRLRHHLRLVDAQPRERNRRRCERHRHAVVVVRVDRL